MRLYRSMQRLVGPLPYVWKLLLICFVGMHIPLITLCAWALTLTDAPIPVAALVVVLVATLAGTAFTLWALRRMLRPIANAASALEAYASNQQMPGLPTEYNDAAGRLMSSVQRTVMVLDQRIDEISRIAMTDGLTGVHNRRWMMDVGVPQVEKALQAGEMTSLLVIDLDEFKAINDFWGHSMGDQVLLAVADGIRSAIRDKDSVVRTGGDEFCVFLPDTDGTTVAQIGERVRMHAHEAVQAVPINRSVTISVGAATSTRGDASFTAIYRRADQHLYAVKQNGRNAVIGDKTVPS
ncbi:GGDEF domain-containing protein [Tianweitania populi]|uniref:diguanylate cyclase n=1 Tax=Tianweitania populi TaxID=1607949 RepID=A0A8J3DV95_9HYPH|nr:GGDEF domain-containing protein [Tianweitania populi]GHD24234.1 transcriptional regulator [Tianweitania populi]